MKPNKVHKIFLLIFIFLLCFESSECQDCQTNCQSTGLACNDNVGTCDSHCKPKYGEVTPICYDCSNIAGDYYTIDSSGNCLEQCIGDKIIGNSGECTSESIPNSFKKIGDVYYDSAQPLMNCGSSECSCNNYYHIKILNGKKIYECFNVINDALAKGYNFYHYNTKEFYETRCPDGFNIMKLITDSNTPPNTYTRCSDKCVGSEFFVEIVDSSNDVTTGYCIDSCESSNTGIFSGYFYTYIDNGINRCLNGCLSGTSIKNIDTSHSICITLDECEFYDEDTNICYDSCPTSSPDKRYYNKGSKKCISSCSGDYLYTKVSGDYTCYRKEDCNFVEESGSTKTCLDSCGPGKYHDYDSKVCTSNCGSSPSTKKYRADDGNVCYDSCSEIQGGEYIYEGEDVSGVSYIICYKQTQSRPNCGYYYKKLNGIRKCSSSISNCIDISYKYILNDECKESCNGYYQIEKETTDTPAKQYTECFQYQSEALSQANFCDEKKKKCWTNFPTESNYYIERQYSSSPAKYEVINECEKL